MKLTDELSIAAPLSKTWPVLLDVPTVARALPGAAIGDTAEQGEYRGRMKVKLGPVTAEYTGVARLQEVDDDDHVARYHVVGREARGQGSAEATITIGARDDDGGTRLRVETELAITGRQAQLGRGVMEEVASGVLREFVGRLEGTITGEGESAGAVDGGEDVFDAGAAVYRPLLERAAILLAGVLVGLGLGRVVWRR
ncbi:MAG: SRPBCC family protein [Solirubrobacteraceae bacterium]